MLLKKFLNILLIIACTITYANALKQDEIEKEMTKKIDNVLLILKKPNLNFSQKGEEIIKIIDEVFNYELMARIALGTTWNSLSNEKQKEFSKIFENKLKESYIEKLKFYKDQKVKIVGLKPYNKTKLQLETELVGNNEIHQINYNFYSRGSDDHWLIYDVNLLGVSIIQTYRQQFAGFLKEKTFDEMLVLLKNPNNK